MRVPRDTTRRFTPKQEMAKNATTTYSSHEVFPWDDGVFPEGLQEQVRFQQEVDYCLARLEEQIQTVNPDSRKAAEMEKALRILSSTKAPFIKKRQVMRNMFGDYREKMKVLEKKSAAAMAKSKFVAGPPRKRTSQYFRDSKSAITDMKRRGNRPRKYFAVLSTGTEVREDGSSSSSAFSNMDACFSLDCRVTAAANASANCGFKFVPSPEEFRFNFDPSGMQQQDWQDTEKRMEDPSQTDCKNSKDFVMKSIGKEFRFNFALKEADNST